MIDAIHGSFAWFEIKATMDFKFGCEGGPSDGAHSKMIVYMDDVSWTFLIKREDLHPFCLT